ncbi:hypothetical protein [Bradyrhizobium genosp. A]|uniref:hypothetical protein n=1 Tax=Bradyrhizobium genosp. A TaxID=83626 RepID=UPI003CF2A49A
MNEPVDCRCDYFECLSAGQTPEDFSSPLDGSRCAALVRLLVREELKQERDRVAKEEAAQWERAFGDGKSMSFPHKRE